MIESIASAYMDMTATQLATNYSTAVTKKAMDAQELAAQELLNMLPSTPSPSKGQYIDVYA